ncbi:MAG TPA: hypothetical protein P5048_03360 [Chlamydiales bacterium]|nr:hypothetical protein [Chlamydiales bacterium]
MKILIVYYSRTGHVEKVANAMEKALTTRGNEVRLIQVKDLQKRQGAIGFIKGGFHAFKEKQTKIECPQIDIQSYDLVFLGTPIWAGKITPAILTFFQKYHRFISNSYWFFNSSGKDISQAIKQVEWISDKKMPSYCHVLDKELKDTSCDLNEKMESFLKSCHV